MIWFYPLNELDITGYEAFVLVIFTPMLWLSSKLEVNVLRAKVFQIFLMMLMLVGIWSFQAESTLQRLVLLAVGVGAAYLLKCCTWWSNDATESKASFWGYAIGYFAVLSSRIWYKSVHPTWSDETSNRIVSTLFSGVIINKLIDLATAKPEEESTVQQDSADKNPKQPQRKQSSKVCGIAYGCHCFLMHTVLGEVSVLSRYTVSGLEVSSPLPNPYGGLVLLASLFGLLLSLHTELPTKKTWLLSGIISGMGLMFLPTWSAFASGLHFVAYLVSVWPSVAENVISCKNAGSSLVTANLFYCLGVFGMVWCTAYNFVPFGGGLARERTYVLILLATCAISYSLIRKSSPAIPIRFRLSVPHSTQKPMGSDDEKRIRNAIFLIVLIGLTGFKYRASTIPEPNLKPENVANGRFSALIWTFHFGYDNQGWPSFERAARLLNDTGADVITLLESDASKPYLGNNDISMWLGERLGMYTDFGPSTRDHTWGTSLLSKYPIVRSQHHLLPSPEGELAPAISATINITGNLLDLVLVHMGNDRDDLDRRLQARKLAQLCNDTPNPVVFLGYVTSKPGSRDYRHLIEQGRLTDIDVTDRKRYCEYVMYRDLKRLGYARISHGGLSDTELQMGTWQLHTEGDGGEDNDQVSTDERDAVDESIRFNPVFGNWFPKHWRGEGNHFHMNTPKYFFKRGRVGGR